MEVIRLGLRGEGLIKIRKGQCGNASRRRQSDLEQRRKAH